MNVAIRWFPARWFSALTGVMETCCLLGGGLGPLILPAFIDSVGWRTTMLYLAVPGILLAFASLLWVRSYPEDSWITVGQVKPSPSREKVIDTFCSSDYALYCLSGFGLFAMISSFGGLWGIPFFNYRFPGEEQEVAASLSMIFLGAGAGAPLIGILAGRLGRQEWIMAGSIVLAILVFILLLATPYPMSRVAPLCFLAGFSSGGYVLVFVQIKRMTPAGYSGIILAGANAAMLLSGPVLQPLTGWILDCQVSREGMLTLRGFQWAFVPLLLFQLLSLLAMGLLIYRRRGHHGKS